MSFKHLRYDVEGPCSERENNAMVTVSNVFDVQRCSRQVYIPLVVATLLFYIGLKRSKLGGILFALCNFIRLVACPQTHDECTSAFTMPAYRALSALVFLAIVEIIFLSWQATTAYKMLADGQLP